MQWSPWLIVRGSEPHPALEKAPDLTRPDVTDGRECATEQRWLTRPAPHDRRDLSINNAASGDRGAI
jgi:hypothetical protein